MKVFRDSLQELCLILALPKPGKTVELKLPEESQGALGYAVIDHYIMRAGQAKIASRAARTHVEDDEDSLRSAAEFQYPQFGATLKRAESRDTPLEILEVLRGPDTLPVGMPPKHL
ncbi:hypothetical protein EBH_0026960 [Eimeria brunetti]|uniref:Uncharacterized protein n=1 Tax=Eimeria brunetti TaxID=51314 RepID=U6M267_9EIME|nr:hypothetical protein EBH_0026960 [Eimeria brunetti]